MVRSSLMCPTPPSTPTTQTQPHTLTGKFGEAHSGKWNLTTSIYGDTLPLPGTGRDFLCVWCSLKTGGSKNIQTGKLRLRKP